VILKGRWTCVVVLLGISTPVFGQKPRAIVEQAVRAMGGEDVLARRTAIHQTLFVDGLSFGGYSEALLETGGKQRFVLGGDTGRGEKACFIRVNDGVKGWIADNGQVQDMNEDQLRECFPAGDLEKAAALLPLLKDRAYLLAALPDEIPDGRPSHHIRASHPGRVDVELFFDKGSGLLVKAAAKVADREILETFYSDYREVGPTRLDRVRVYGDGAEMSDGELVAFVRKRTPDPAPLVRAPALVKQLGDESFEAREQAARELVAMGKVVVPCLQRALRDPDAEVVRGARECLERVGAHVDSVMAGAVRIVGWRRPDGGCQALLDLLPTADESLAPEVKAALVVYADRDGKPDPALLRALDDTDPVRRTAARDVLGRDGGAYLREPGRRVFLHGLRHPMTLSQRRGDRRPNIRSLREVEFFNDFDPELFARPDGR
jgi:hypothetical protein